MKNQVMRQEGIERILLLDSDLQTSRAMAINLLKEGYNVFESSSPREALDVLYKVKPDAVVTSLETIDALRFVERVSDVYPEIPIILLKSNDKSGLRGISDYGGQCDPALVSRVVRLRNVVTKVIEQKAGVDRPKLVWKWFVEERERQRVIANTPIMLEMLQTVNKVKDCSSNVLIVGETGTGKELVANVLHYESVRKDKPFVPVNCAAMPRELMESELFGHEKGAFTGAHAQRIGKFEKAAGGTILLDEISELDIGLQSKLLRVLQEKKVERLGGNELISVDFRLVCSTNRDLVSEVELGNFREDLYYRINVLNVQVPPLRDRLDDVELLVEAFRKEFCTREKKRVAISADVLKILKVYPWPGNVRQLRNVVERCVMLAHDTIKVDDLPSELQPARQFGTDKANGRLREAEAKMIRDSLLTCKGNKSKAARLLGISRKALYRRLVDLGLHNRN